MSKKVIRQFEEQFGKEWRCQCNSAFKPGNLEILSESANSLLAHYKCPSCGREQMLAAAISESEETASTVSKPERIVKLPKATITTDDVLDIKMILERVKFSTIKSLSSQRIRKKQALTVSKVSPPKS